MNQIVINGNLTKDAELTLVGSKNTPKLAFSLANNEGWGDNKKTTFVNCVLWGKSAESIVNYMTKGQKVLVKGKLEIRSYEKDGVTKYITEIVADMFGGVEFAGNGGQTTDNNSSTKEEVWTGEPVDNGDLPF